MQLRLPIGVDTLEEQIAVRHHDGKPRILEHQALIAAERRHREDAVQRIGLAIVEDARAIRRPVVNHRQAASAIARQHAPGAAVRLHDADLRLAVDEGLKGEQLSVGRKRRAASRSAGRPRAPRDQSRCGWLAGVRGQSAAAAIAAAAMRVIATSGDPRREPRP